MPEPQAETVSIAQPEKPAVSRAPETRPAEKPMGRTEQQIINRIDQDGDPDNVLSDIAGGANVSPETPKNPAQPAVTPGGEKPVPDEAAIDMIKGSDGKWTTRSPDDPNFFYSPKENPATVGAQPNPSVEQSSYQKPKDAWAEWQAGEAQRNDLYQQFNQVANDAWSNIQQQMASAKPEAGTRPPSIRPLNWEEKPSFTAKPVDANVQENRSPKEAWAATEQRGQHKETQKQQELQNLQTEGTRLATLVYTPEGQQQIAETRASLTQIVEATSRKPKMETVHPGFDRSPTAIEEVRQRNEHLMQAWQQSKEARVGRLLRGDEMNNLEEGAYLTQVLGHEPLTTTSVEENRQRDVLIAEFNKQRHDIGRALLYQSSDTQPVEQRYFSTSEARSRFYGISITEVQESFARGWDGIKMKVEVEQKSNNNETEKPEIVGGLSLTFQDAIEFHEHSGNHQLAEQLRQAGLAEIKQVNNATLIGETHIRTIIDKENEEKFQQAIDSNEIIIVEHDSLVNNPYSTSSPEKRFMQEAQEHALATGKQLHILDTELGTDLEDKYALVESGNLGLSQEEYAYMASISALMREFISGMPINNIDAALRARLSTFLTDEKQVSEVVDEAVSQFIQTLQDPTKLQEFQSVIISFASIDSAARERGYQQKIAEIIESDPNKRVAIIVGKSHLEPIARNITESYITPPDATSVDVMRGARNNLRNSVPPQAGG